MIVKNNLGELSNIFSELETISSKFGIPLEIQNNLCLCIDEVFSNIVKYAYDDGKEHEIEIVFDYDAQNKIFTITISDDGRPFNPLEVHAPDLTIDLLDRIIGGLGLYIVMNIMSNVEYIRDGCINRLKMTKDIEVEESSE